MGNHASAESSGSQKETRPVFLIMGLVGAGKSTLMYQMQRGEPVTRVSTVGFNTELFESNSGTFFLWDIDSQPTPRVPLAEVQGLVFIVDATDAEQLPRAASALEKVLLDDPHVLPLLILANKSDIATALSDAVLSEKLRLSALLPVADAAAAPAPRQRQWQLHRCSALLGEIPGTSLQAGMTWIASQSKIDMTSKLLAVT
jgi:ADP-ribosylation factor-like protein 1